MCQNLYSIIFFFLNIFEIEVNRVTERGDEILLQLENIY